MAGAIIDMVSQDWGTPKYLWDPAAYVFGGSIGLDPCSNPDSGVVAKTRVWLPQWAEGYVGAQQVDGNPYSSLGQLPAGVVVGDGLAVNWTTYDSVFVNPPYGRNKADGTSIYDWVHKAAFTGSGRAAGVIALIPAAVGTRHWQDIIFKTAHKVCFLRGRVKFELKGKNNVSTTPSAVVLWGDGQEMNERFDEAFSKLGKVY